MIPTINAWVEPFGIGGHAVLSPNNGKPGCYGCVFINRQDRSKLQFTPNINFLAEDQDYPIERSVGTCAGRFLPYSKLDAAADGYSSNSANFRLPVRENNERTLGFLVLWPQELLSRTGQMSNDPAI